MAIKSDSLFMILNKNILFIAPQFFGYANIIRKRLQEYGGNIDLFYELPVDYFSKLLLQTPLRHKVIDRYYEKIAKKLKKSYDSIFVIKGLYIPINFYSLLKDRFPNAEFIQYHWDDIDLYPKIKQTFGYFDRIYTYNILDHEKYNLIFRPFFYDESLVGGESHEKEIDLFFIGSYTKPRMNFILRFFSLIPTKQICSVKYFYINVFTFLQERLPLKYCNVFCYSKLPYGAMMDYLCRAKTTLDVPYSPQQGLTTRSFEALGCKTKIITTNKNIVKYDFYNEANICIVDYDSPFVDINWIQKPYKEYSASILQKYTLEKWLEDIFIV